MTTHTHSRRITPAEARACAEHVAGGGYFTSVCADERRCVCGRDILEHRDGRCPGDDAEARATKEARIAAGERCATKVVAALLVAVSALVALVVAG